MRRVLVPGVLALVVLAGAALPAAAGEKKGLRGRLVSLRLSRAPAAPPVVVEPQPVPPPPVPVEPPPGVPLEVAPPAPPVPLPSASLAPPARPLTVKEFACSFRPTCGTHHVTLLHPFTGCPVNVCLTLPEGCPKVRVKTCLRQRVEIDYGCKDVEIVFYRNGRVKVDYD
jgi:hypothetical protein